MGTVLGISKDLFDDTKAEFRTGGFSVPPSGAHIQWIIKGHRLGSYKNQEDNDVEYLVIDCVMTDDDGDEHKHGQFLTLESAEDIGQLKAFVHGIGRTDWNPEDDDIEDLEGTMFYCDYVHYESKNKKTGQIETKGRFEWKTLVPINWIDGKPVDATDTVATEEAYTEKEEGLAAKKRRPGRPRKEDIGEPIDDGAGDDDPDGADEETGFKSFSPRRTRRRRAAASDKD